MPLAEPDGLLPFVAPVRPAPLVPVRLLLVLFLIYVSKNRAQSYVNLTDFPTFTE